MSRYWLQTKAPAGSWCDSIGSDNKRMLFQHGRYMGDTFRVVERVDTPVEEQDYAVRLTSDEGGVEWLAGPSYTVPDKNAAMHMTLDDATKYLDSHWTTLDSVGIKAEIVNVI